MTVHSSSDSEPKEERGRPGRHAVPNQAMVARATHLWQRGFSTLAGEVTNFHLRLRIAHIALFFAPPLCGNWIRTRIYRGCGFQIGEHTLIGGNLSLSGSPGIYERLRIGRAGFLNSHVHFDLNAPIEIGDSVYIGHHTMFITSNHKIGPEWQRCGEVFYEPISIGDGCWIGAGVTILPGVKIGRGAVVAAGALVNKEVPPNTIVAGIPARVIRRLE